MRKYNKLIMILIVLMLAMTFMLVACDTDPDPDPDPDKDPDKEKPAIVLTNEQMYEAVRTAHVSANGYTLKTDSINNTNPENPIVLYYYEEVTVAEGIATKTIEEQKLAQLGGTPGPDTTSVALPGYRGSIISAKLLTAYLTEGYTCVKEGDIITVTGTLTSPASVQGMFGSNAISYKDMSIVIVADYSKKIIVKYTASFTQSNNYGDFASVMKYETKAAAIAE